MDSSISVFQQTCNFTMCSCRFNGLILQGGIIYLFSLVECTHLCHSLGVLAVSWKDQGYKKYCKLASKEYLTCYLERPDLRTLNQWKGQLLLLPSQLSARSVTTFEYITWSHLPGSTYITWSHLVSTNSRALLRQLVRKKPVLWKMNWSHCNAAVSHSMGLVF